MGPEATEITTATYDEIAPEYAARWGRAEVLAETRQRFAALLTAGAWVLDVGCGPGRDAALLRELGLRTVGLDRSRSMLIEARGRGVSAALADMRCLPAADAALDGLWVSASLLHLPKQDAPVALMEFRRVLKPGGVLYLGVKAGAGEGWVEAEGYGSGGRQRWFSYYEAAELDELLTAAGLLGIDGWESEVGGQRWLSRLCRPR